MTIWTKPVRRAPSTERSRPDRRGPGPSSTALSATRTFSGSKRRVTVPLDRSLRTPVGNYRPYLRGGDGRQERKALAAWAAAPDYRDWRRLLARYVAETLHDPVRLQGLWTLSFDSVADAAEPSRRSTLSVGGTETLVLEAQGVRTSALLNVADTDGLAGALDTLDEHLWHHRGHYGIRRHCPVRSILVEDHIELATRLLQRADVLDAAYRLNAYLMRFGGTQLADTHNRAVAEDVLGLNGPT